MLRYIFRAEFDVCKPPQAGPSYAENQQFAGRDLRYVAEYQRRQFPRLRLIANNTRVMAANLWRLSADWQETFGHPLELAEVFVDSPRASGL